MLFRLFFGATKVVSEDSCSPHSAGEETLRVKRVLALIKSQRRSHEFEWLVERLPLPYGVGSFEKLTALIDEYRTKYPPVATT